MLVIVLSRFILPMVITLETINQKGEKMVIAFKIGTITTKSKEVVYYTHLFGNKTLYMQCLAEE